MNIREIISRDWERELQKIRYLHWYLNPADQIPLCSDLELSLPLPYLERVKVMWPDRYSWGSAYSRLNPIKRELSRFVPVEMYNVASRNFSWHEKGGFPVPDDKKDLIGKPCCPIDANDIRGELFEIHAGESIISCAYDFSDYPVVSTEILDQVDVYFKVMPSPTHLSSKVFPIGQYVKNPRLLGIARSKFMKNSPEKKFDVYGRFGSWTDSQSIRKNVVQNLIDSHLTFRGGFGIRIYPEYLVELMHSKIALDLPGQATVTCRIGEIMALGAIAVSIKPNCVFPEELIEGLHYVGIDEDGSDVVDVCDALLRDGERMIRIIEQGMLYFDRNFSPQSMARRILRGALSVSSFQN